MHFPAFADRGQHTGVEGGSLFQATGRRVNVEQANAAFACLGHTPGLFQDAVERMMKLGGMDIMNVAHQVLTESRDAAGYLQRLMQMRPLDREVIRAVIQRAPLYAEETRLRFARSIGIEGETRTARQVQIAIDRLRPE